MSDSDDALVRYVRATAQLTQMPLTSERLTAVAATMTRIAAFAEDLHAFALADDVEIAGPFIP